VRNRKIHPGRLTIDSRHSILFWIIWGETMNIEPPNEHIRENPWKYSASAILLIATIAWYGFLLTGPGFDFHWHTDPNNSTDALQLTFNSMADHLIHGTFDVDPAKVGTEGFFRDGHMYAYWGIFFALIRLPLALFRGGLSIDVTSLSIFVAVCIAAFFKFRTLGLLFSRSPASEAIKLFYWALALSILFSGPQVEFLRRSIFQEVCCWAGALAASFVFFAIRGIVTERFSAFALSAMAFIAGLALNARVSIGVGLYAALGLLMVATQFLDASELKMSNKQGVDRLRGIARIFLSHQFLLPLLVLAVFALFAGFVNYERWRDPLIFADYNLHLYNSRTPDRLLRMHTYGLFNIARVPFGIVYYFIPIWIFHGADGHLFFEGVQSKLFDEVELPPSSFFLTDPWLVMLLVYAIWAFLFVRIIVQKNIGVHRLQILAIGTGLVVPCALILAAISMCYRYRIDFYPFIEFGAFLGVLLLVRSSSMPTPSLLMRASTIIVTLLGILGSHAMLLLYDASPYGSATKPLSNGIVALYANVIAPGH
jgi:hypothetical protein